MQGNNTHDAQNGAFSSGKYKLRKRGRKSMKDTNGGEGQGNATNKVVRQKICIELIDYLHAKFLEAVHNSVKEVNLLHY